jgi:hypothetical protein
LEMQTEQHTLAVVHTLAAEGFWEIVPHGCL